MTLTTFAEIASIISAFVGIISIIISLCINSKVKKIVSNYTISTIEKSNNQNHHNQKVGGIGNSATYSVTGDK